MNKCFTYKCMDCKREYKEDKWKNTIDGKRCSCGGALILKKNSGITISVDIDADEAKAKLNDIEQQMDRIIDKYKFIGIDMAKGKDRTVYSSGVRTVPPTNSKAPKAPGRQR